jgi:threonine/homoserine/homoserine lactone efflux protein
VIAYLLNGMALGLTAGVQPGPLQAVLIQVTLARGWRRSIVGVFAPLIADIPIVILTLILLSQVSSTVVRLLQIGGGAFLLYLAYQSWRSWRSGAALGDTGEASADTELNWRYFLRMVTVIWLSPGPYIFWGTVNGPLFIQGLQESLLSGLAFLVGFYGAFIGFLSAIVIVFDRLRHVDRRVTRVILLATVIALAVFGLRFLAQGLGLIAG